MRNDSQTREIEKKYRTIGDALRPLPFHEDLPKETKDSLIGSEVVYYDWRIVKGWNSKDSNYPPSDFAIVAVGSEKSGNPEFTCIVSGVVVIRKLQELQRKGLRPVTATLIKTENKDGKEMWDLI